MFQLFSNLVFPDVKPKTELSCATDKQLLLSPVVSKSKESVPRRFDKLKRKATALRKSVFKRGKTFKCIYCEKKFPRLEILWRHVVTHNKSGEGYQISTARKQRAKQHSKHQKYECGQCGKQFISQHALIKCLRAHDGERPFVCKICKRGFKVPTGLKLHFGLHFPTPTETVPAKTSKRGTLKTNPANPKYEAGHVQCKQCRNFCSSGRELGLHYNAVHNLPIVQLRKMTICQFS